MRNPQFHVSGESPMEKPNDESTEWTNMLSRRYFSGDDVFSVMSVNSLLSYGLSFVVMYQWLIIIMTVMNIL